MPEHAVVQKAYQALGPWARADTNQQLLAYLRVLLDPLLDVDDIVRDTDTHVGWGVLMDVDAAPEWVLPWLAQFVGVTTLPGLSAPSQRLRIKKAAGFSRGTPAAIKAAAQQFLTGTKTVELYERDGGIWRFRLRTYLSETPDSQKVYDAVLALKPAGVVLAYEVQNGIEINGLTGTIDSLVGTIASYNNSVPF